MLHVFARPNQHVTAEQARAVLQEARGYDVLAPESGYLTRLQHDEMMATYRRIVNDADHDEGRRLRRLADKQFQGPDKQYAHTLIHGMAEGHLPVTFLEVHEKPLPGNLDAYEKLLDQASVNAFVQGNPHEAMQKAFQRMTHSSGVWRERERAINAHLPKMEHELRQAYPRLSALDRPIRVFAPMGMSHHWAKRSPHRETAHVRIREIRDTPFEEFTMGHQAIDRLVENPGKSSQIESDSKLLLFSAFEHLIPIVFHAYHRLPPVTGYRRLFERTSLDELKRLSQSGALLSGHNALLDFLRKKEVRTLIPSG